MTSRLVLRGGYGIYYSRTTGQVAAQSVLAAPFSLTRINTGLTNAAATFQDTLRAAISHASFISTVCALFPNHEVLGQCSSPQFSAGNGPTVLTERPRRIRQRLGCWRSGTWAPGEHICNAFVP